MQLQPQVSRGDGSSSADDWMLNIVRTGEGYLVVHAGFVIPMREKNDQLVSDVLPATDDCPFQRRQCDPPITSVKRIKNGFAAGQRNYRAPDEPHFTAPRKRLELKSIQNGPMRAVFENGLVGFGFRRNEKEKCSIGILAPYGKNEQPQKSEEYSLKAFPVMLVSLKETDGCDKISVTDDFRHSKFDPVGGLVVDASGRPVCIVIVGYMFQEMLVDPSLSREEMKAAVQLGFKAIGIGKDETYQ
ncbi:MAG: hypothetical protein JNM27_23240 [Leptospirales bacterium]|nr:hypothetical protein [Leptospirales bacterium]